MSQEVYVVNTCNEWKDYASFRLVGVYNDLTKLQEELWDRFLVDEICFQGRSWPDIQEAIHEEWASRWEDEDVEEDGGDLEEDILQAIQEKKQELEESFKQLDARTLHEMCDYISIQVRTLNEVY